MLDPAFRSGFVNATRWFVTIVNQPNYLAVKGTTTLAEKVAVPAKKEKEEKPKKEAKPKAEPKPKEEKPKKEEAPAGDEGEEEEGEKEEKKKNPLDNLPKSSFIMDEWKRMYSNNDTRTVALPWFHSNYDPAGMSLTPPPPPPSPLRVVSCLVGNAFPLVNVVPTTRKSSSRFPSLRPPTPCSPPCLMIPLGYSLFWSKYKYNSELPAAVFMVNNLVGGYFQRLEKLHKYAFGTMNLYGTAEEGWDLQGVWLFRGSEIPPDVCFLSFFSFSPRFLAVVFSRRAIPHLSVSTRRGGPIHRGVRWT